MNQSETTAMKTAPRPLPTWLKWLMRVFGALMLVAVLACVPFLWKAVRSIIPLLKQGAHVSRHVQISALAKLLGEMVGVVIWTCVAVWLLRRSWIRKEKPAEAVVASAGDVGTAATAAPRASPRSTTRHWQSCNVLQVAPQACQLWQFEARHGDFLLDREESTPLGEPLTSLVNKTWHSLWQPKLNVAWLPPESVFFRVVHLPQSSFDETFSMVELQLEKLSPIPVTQVVWSMHVLPQRAGNLQTLIVTFVERKAVEEFLGQLEGQGYLADRLELPILDQLLATPIGEDGAWIYPRALGGKNTALVAWWYGGVLQNLNFITPPPAGDHATSLKEQLAQMAWAGELEGWLTTPPTWHLVGDEATVAEWEPPLRQGLGDPIVILHPLSPAELAALTAQRAARTQQIINLLPAEYATRYQQQFVDRLWMRGLAAVVSLYMAGAMIYFIALEVLVLQTRSVEKQVAALSGNYENARQLKARYDVLKDRQELKFAALDCWKATAEKTPPLITIDGLVFNDGKKLKLNGTAPADQTGDLIDYSAAMRKTEINGQAIFDPAKGEQLSYRMNPGNSTVSWNFAFELKRKEAE